MKISPCISTCVKSITNSTLSHRRALLAASLAFAFLIAAAPLAHTAKMNASRLSYSRGVNCGEVLRELPAVAQQPRGHDYGQLPLAFEANQGQVDSRVKFMSRGSGYNLFLTPTEAVLTLREEKGKAKTLENEATGRSRVGTLDPRGRMEKKPAPSKRATVRMKLVGGNEKTEVAGVEQQTGRVNYFIGNDPAKWQTGVPTFGRVQYKNVYRGVDLIYHGQQRQLEYDFIVKPGADPNQIRLRFDGARKIRIDESGNLVLTTKGGEVIQHKPVVYQEVAGSRKEVAGGYILKTNREVRFEIGNYDISERLVIDPVLSYSTYFGGGNPDLGYSIAVDPAGNAYVAGYTNSINFPTLNAYQASMAGNTNAFVIKLTASGALSYSTYLGGNADDGGMGIATDSAGNAYVTGFASSSNFPILNAYQSSHASDNGNLDAFVTKLTANGALSYSTYLGGIYQETGNGVAVDLAGNAYVAGSTSSPDFPTFNAYQGSPSSGPANFDAFVTKLTPVGGLDYSTYLGGGGSDFPHGLDAGNAIAVDPNGNAYVTGFTGSATFPTLNAYQESIGGYSAGYYDAFVSKFTVSGVLVYSTYLAGNGDDRGYGIAVDSAGSAYVTGWTYSTNFPTLNAFQGSYAGGVFDPPNASLGGYYDAFVTKLTPGGDSLSYSTYLGGSSSDQPQGIAVDSAGNAYVIGFTKSTDFPTLNAYQASSGGDFDAFVFKLTASGGLSSSTYLGRSGAEYVGGIAVDSAGDAYVTGWTDSANFPIWNAYQPSYGGIVDAFITKIAEGVTPTPTPTPTPTITLFSNRDSFLRSGADDTNEGANERLRIQNSGDNRAVVAFNLTGVSTVGLQSATLVLTIAENSNNWGSTGRLVDAQRLLIDWIEGNGRNDVLAGGGPGIRGTGAGVTWHCGIDTNIVNQSANCSPLWNGGSFAAASAPGVLHRNGLLGQVSWNVTADVLAGTNFGWIVRKREENQNGQVRYYSREGAALAGNANLGPRLVLVYSH